MVRHPSGAVSGRADVVGVEVVVVVVRTAPGLLVDVVGTAVVVVVVATAIDSGDSVVGVLTGWLGRVPSLVRTAKVAPRLHAAVPTTNTTSPTAHIGRMCLTHHHKSRRHRDAASRPTLCSL